LLAVNNAFPVVPGGEPGFSYLSASNEFIYKIIEQANLEGFYYDSRTRADWFYRKLIENVIDLESSRPIKTLLRKF